MNFNYYQCYNVPALEQPGSEPISHHLQDRAMGPEYDRHSEIASDSG